MFIGLSDTSGGRGPLSTLPHTQHPPHHPQSRLSATASGHPPPVAQPTGLTRAGRTGQKGEGQPGQGFEPRWLRTHPCPLLVLHVLCTLPNQHCTSTDTEPSWLAGRQGTCDSWNSPGSCPEQLSSYWAEATAPGITAQSSAPTQTSGTDYAEPAPTT